jgi:hypothetical protein
MRSNGLPAAKFDVLRDVDQLVSARLLQLLAEAGIAAYARQRPNAVDPTRMDIVDRLWVDATRREEADRLVADHLPALLDRDEDALFAEIISGWDDDGGSPVGAWPVQEDADTELPPHGDDDSATVRRRLVRPAEPSMPPADVEDPDDHFVPPPPPPLPRVDKATGVGLGALVAGIAFLLAVWATGASIDAIWEWLALAVAVTGAVSLIARMGDKLPPEEAGPDDGAVL